MSSLRIAIIGAGPAGLTLARLLQVSKIPCTIFELEPSAHGRDQGGTIDLHKRGGQSSLLEAGLMEEFKKFSRPEGEFDKLVKFDGTLILDEKAEMPADRPADDADRPEIDRQNLRQLLLDSLLPDTVRWGKKLIAVEPSTTTPAKYNLRFADSMEYDFDLVVGADGAWSKVRSLLTDIKPHYSSVTAIELWALDVDQKQPWLSQYVADGSMFMFDQGRAIMRQRNGNNSVRTYACVRQPETWLEDCGIDWSQPKTARQKLVEGPFADCGDDLKRCILDSKDKLVTRALYMLPVGVKWEHRAGVTLIGDSAHLMTPFAGVGVNVAMVDALELSRAIVRAKDDPTSLGSNLATFEEDMFKRGELFARKTWKGLEGHFSATGGEERAAKFRAQVAAFKARSQAS